MLVPANPEMKFDTVMEWETKAEGFPGMNRIKGLSFPTFGWVTSTSPL